MATGHKMYLEQSEYIKELEDALDKACAYLSAAQMSDDFSNIKLLNKKQWKEWLLNDK